MPEMNIAEYLPDWIKDHLKLYLESGGKEGHMWDSTVAGGPGLLPSLLLATTGRKSGNTLTLPLIYGEADGNYIVIASKGGAPAHPSWFFNLEANPNVSLMVGEKKCDATARVATGGERATIWAMMEKIYPPYNDYQTSAGDREIPVVVLEPK